MQIDNIIDSNTFRRKIANFHFLDIPNIVRLGNVNMTHSPDPFQEDAPFSVPEIHPDCYELVFMADGLGYCKFKDHSVSIRGGEMLITFPNEEHQYHINKSHLFYLIFECMPQSRSFLDMTPEASKEISKTFQAQKQRIVNYTPKVLSLLNKIMTAYFKESIFKKDYIHALFTELFIEIYLLLKGQKKQDETCEPEYMSEIVSYVEHHFLDTECSQNIASMFYLSPSHFSRQFKAATGFTLHDYILRKKIDWAKNRLLESNLTITAISDELNFSSSSHFSNVFKKYTALSPLEFRNKMRLSK